MKKSVNLTKTFATLLLMLFSIEGFSMQSFHSSHSTLCDSLLTTVWGDDHGVFFSEAAKPYRDAIRSERTSEAPRLQLAAWLEEHWDHKLAQFIRLEIEEDRLIAKRQKGGLSTEERQESQRISDQVKTLYPGNGNINNFSVLGPLLRIDNAWFHTQRGMLTQVSSELGSLLNYESLLLEYAPALTEFSFRSGSHSDFIRFLTSKILFTATFLVFDSCNIGQNGLARLANGNALPNLKYINIRKDNLGEEGLLALAKSKRFTGVTQISIEDANITIEGIAQILALGNFPSLNSIAVRQMGPRIPLPGGGYRARGIFSEEDYKRLNRIRPGVTVFGI